MCATADEEEVAWAIEAVHAQWDRAHGQNLVVVSPLTNSHLLREILPQPGGMLLPPQLAKGNLDSLFQAAERWAALVPIDLHAWSEDAFGQLLAFAARSSCLIVAISDPAAYLVPPRASLQVAETRLTDYLTLDRRAMALNALMIETPHSFVREVELGVPSTYWPEGSGPLHQGVAL